MAIDVHDRRNAGTYDVREADESWRRPSPGSRTHWPARGRHRLWRGLVVVGRHRFSERRRTYANLKELNADLHARTGRSILHGLTDEELSRLADCCCLYAGLWRRQR
jgi:hypothetical protein